MPAGRGVDDRRRSAMAAERPRCAWSFDSLLAGGKVFSMRETSYQADPDSPGEAAALLAVADAATMGIWSTTPKEWKVFLLWGVWVLVFVPPFDFLTGNAWWPVVWIASAAPVGWLPPCTSCLGRVASTGADNPHGAIGWSSSSSTR